MKKKPLVDFFPLFITTTISFDGVQINMQDTEVVRIVKKEQNFKTFFTETAIKF